MSQSFSQNLQKFEKRTPDIIISVQINNQQYQIRVSEKQTIKSIIDRFKRNDFFSFDDAIVYMNDENVQANLTVDQLKKMNNKKDISIRIISQKNQNSERQKEKDRNSVKSQPKQGQNKSKALRSTQSLRISAEDFKSSSIASTRNQSVRMRPETQNIKNLSTSVQFVITYQQFQQIIEGCLNKKDQGSKLKKYQLFSSFLNEKLLLLQNSKQLQPNNKKQQKIQSISADFSPLIKILKQLNSSKLNQQIDIKSLQKLGQPKFIQQLQSELNQIRTKIMTISDNSKFNRNALNSLKNLSKLVEDKEILKNIKKQSSDEKRASCISFLGKDQTEILDQIKKIQACTKHIKECKQKMQIQIKENSKNIQSLKLQISKLTVQISSIKKTYQQKMMKKSSNANIRTGLSFDVVTPLINGQNKDKMMYLEKQIFKYQGINQKNMQNQKLAIKQIQSLFVLKKSQILYQSICNMLDNIDFGRLDRIVMLITLQNKVMLAFYSTIGLSSTNKPINKYQTAAKYKTDQIKCKSGKGFLSLLQEKKTLVHVNREKDEFIVYDDKFITIASCFNILVNMKKRIQIQYKQLRRGQLKDDDDILGQVFSEKKKMEIVSLQILRVGVGYDTQQQTKMEKQYNVLQQKLDAKIQNI